MQKKLAVLFLIVMLALIALSTRLTYINAESGEQYSKQVLSQQQYDSRTIPYKRGDIVDRKGTVIATSEKVYNIIMDCKIINSKEDYIEPTIKALVTAFAIEESEIREILTSKSDSSYHILRKQLSYEEIQTFVEMDNDNKTYPNIKGIWFEEEYVRKYPYSALASDFIGFSASDNTGFWGIEEYYNEELNGTNGREYGYLNDDSNFERTTQAATDGNIVVSTVDVNIQNIVEKHITAFNETHNYDQSGQGFKNAAVMIMDPNTGEVLAQASAPNFDLNNPYDLSGLYTEEELDTMEDTQKQEILNLLWRNYTISDTFEPGSTVKPFTIATALEAGILTGNETYFCDGSETVGGHTIDCAKKTGHGLLTVEEALMYSCNDAMMQMSYSIGAKVFTEYQSIFNFGKKTNIDLPGEVNAASLIYTLENMTPVDLATNAFGQNFNVTMTQVIAAYSSLINGGFYYEPHVVSKVLNAQGGTVKTIKPNLVKQTVSSTTSGKLKQYLYMTVDGGTGKSAKVPGYSMGGKTGTAEKIPRGNKKYIVSFIGHAPADHPEVVIYVVIDEPNTEIQSNSALATNLSKEIMAEVLPYLNIFPNEEITSEEGTGNSEGTGAAEGTGEAENRSEAGTVEGTENTEGRENTGEPENSEGGENTGESENIEETGSTAENGNAEGSEMDEEPEDPDASIFH